jgi:hypothetical protein
MNAVIEKKKEKQISKYEELVNAITWDNWEKTTDKGELIFKKNGEQDFFQISEVLYCRLDWLKEQIQSDTIEKEEALDTIEMLQIFVSGIKDTQIKRSK